MTDINFLKNNLRPFQEILNEYYEYLQPSVNLVILQNRLTELKNDINKWEQREKIRNQVKKLLNRYQPQQLSKEWFDLRSKMLSASSDIGVITGLSYSQSHGKTRPFKIDENKRKKEIEELILKKCGYELCKFTGNDSTRFGSKFEEVANKIYQYKTKNTVLQFGLLQHPKYSFIGASPDGITTTGIMIEIKCPPKRKITGIVPENYWCQMQVQMDVADLNECDFVECSFVECSKEECMESAQEFKGVIGEMYKCSCDCSCNCYNNLDNRIYIYPSEIIDTITNQKKNIKNDYYTKYAHLYKFKNFNYWILNVYSQVKVERDTVWWNENIKKITDTWNEILRYRSDKNLVNELVNCHLTQEQTKKQNDFSACFE